MDHKIYTEEDEKNPDRSFWECSCGTSGSCPTYKVDQASDNHINYDAGDTRVDTNYRTL